MVVYDVSGPGMYKSPALTYYQSDDLQWTVNDTLESEWPDVEITHYVHGEPVRGSVSGQLSRRTNLNPPEYEYIMFELEFSAEYGAVVDSQLCNPEN